MKYKSKKQRKVKDQEFKIISDDTAGNKAGKAKLQEVSKEK